MGTKFAVDHLRTSSRSWRQLERRLLSPGAVESRTKLVLLIKKRFSGFVTDFCKQTHTS